MTTEIADDGWIEETIAGLELDHEEDIHRNDGVSVSPCSECGIYTPIGCRCDGCGLLQNE